jgi:uncharacterized membrane protein
MRFLLHKSPNGHPAASPLVARNAAAVAQIEAAERARRTSAERFSDAIARIAGSPWFAGLHVLWFAGWMAWNTGLVSGWRPVDPFPFSFLTLVVSLEAIFLSIFVLVSQNHLTRQSERRAHLDLQINLLAEQESTKTVALLERIAVHLHVPVPTDPSERELAAPTNVRDVVSTLDRALADRPEPSEGSLEDDGAHDPRTNLERPIRPSAESPVGGA